MWGRAGSSPGAHAVRNPPGEFKRMDIRLVSLGTEQAGPHASRATQSLLPALRVQRAEDDAAHGVVPPEEEPVGTWGVTMACGRSPQGRLPEACRPAGRALCVAADARGQWRASWERWRSGSARRDRISRPSLVGERAPTGGWPHHLQLTSAMSGQCPLPGLPLHSPLSGALTKGSEASRAPCSAAELAAPPPRGMCDSIGDSSALGRSLPWCGGR